jgi:hypothetical protein
MTEREGIQSLIKAVLDDTEMRLRVDRYRLEENFENGEVEVHADLHDERSGLPQVIDGRGVGLVDAFFNGLVGLHSTEYESLKSIRFADFSIKAEVATGRASARSDMAARVTLHVANSEHREFTFVHSSPSITGSSIAVVVQAVEFFINSERAFVAVYRALEHAREQNRPDSVARYTTQLSTLVEATSYSEVIERIRAKELKR